ncbi:MAG: dihydroorotase [Thermoplasmatales archaeon]|nr:dihydroorotase [Thermoplasmatales archaeon]
MMDLVVEGNLYLKGEIIKGCVGIEDGKIKAVKKILKGDEKLDFGEKLIMPAGVDAHVHFRDPGFTYKEDFSTGSMSAAFGGISCVLDMPNTKPKVNTANVFKEKLGIAKGKSYVDFGLYADGNSDEIENLGKICTGFKIYSYEMDDNLLEKKLNEIEKTGKTVAVHGEDKNFFREMKTSNLSDYLHSRPNEAEEKMIQKIVSMNKKNVHICHISAKESINILKNNGVTSEVTPHHLLLNIDSDLGPKGKVNPPLRTEKDNEALWDALRNGTIDIVASDHAPHTLEEKQEFDDASPGVPGVETTLPIMMYFTKNEKISLSRVVNAVCEKPSEIFGLNKGKIKEGSDADLIVFDLKNEKKISANMLHSKCGWTPFENFHGVFPVCTIIRGEIVVENNEIMVNPGFGKFAGEKYA